MIVRGRNSLGNLIIEAQIRFGDFFLGLLLKMVWFQFKWSFRNSFFLKICIIHQFVLNLLKLILMIRIGCWMVRNINQVRRWLSAVPLRFILLVILAFGQNQTELEFKIADHQAESCVDLREMHKKKVRFLILKDSIFVGFEIRVAKHLSPLIQNKYFIYYFNIQPIY